jgi:hypothetical protein
MTKPDEPKPAEPAGANRAAPPGRVHYAWIVAAVTFVILLSAAAVRATPSVIIVPLQRELGWSRALISGAVSSSLVLYGRRGARCARTGAPGGEHVLARARRAPACDASP